VQDVNELPPDDPRGQVLPVRVERFLKGVNPLVTITVVGERNAASNSVPVSRTMGAIIEVYPRGVRLVVTCRHSLQSWVGKPHGLIPAFSKPPRVVTLRPLGGPIMDTEEESDVAFLLVQDTEQTGVTPFALTRQDRVIGGQTLYNASNQCDPIARTYEVFKAQQVGTRELCWRGLYKFSEKVKHFLTEEETEKYNQMRTEGWRPCRMLKMISRPSFSGSPVWDDRLRLVGMNIGGSHPGTENYDLRGDVAICIPVSELFEARRRVEPLIRERFSHSR